MRYLTPKQIEERRVIGAFLPTIMKGEIETLQLSNMIHGEIVYGMHERGWDLETTLNHLDSYLQVNPSTSVNGDNVDGWRTKYRYLTDNQREAVKAMIRIVYQCGGAFSNYERTCE